MTLQSAAPVLEPKSSERLKSIEQRILREFPGRIHYFRIELLDGGLALEGRTKTYYGMQQVLHAVMNATQLPILANNIVVDRVESDGISRQSVTSNCETSGE